MFIQQLQEYIFWVNEIYSISENTVLWQKCSENLRLLIYNAVTHVLSKILTTENDNSYNLH